MRRIQHLIGLDHIRQKDPVVSLGVASIVSLLRASELPYTQRSFNVASPAFSAAEVIDHCRTVASSRQHDVWLGAFVWNEPHVQEVLAGLRAANFPARIGVAGPQVSYAADPGSLELLYPGADMFIRGDGEEAVAAAARGETHARGLHIAGQDDRVERARAQIETLPSPHLDDTLAPSIFSRWESTRGCPFSCSFCQHRAAGGGTQQVGAARVEREILHLRRHSRDVAVLDPTFNHATGWAVQVLRQWEGWDGKISLQTRPERLNGRFLDAVDVLRKSGTRAVLELGVQTMDTMCLGEIARAKGSDPVKVIERVRKGIADVADRGIEHEVSLILVFHTSRLLHFAETLKSFQSCLRQLKSMLFRSCCLEERLCLMLEIGLS